MKKILALLLIAFMAVFFVGYIPTVAMATTVAEKCGELPAAVGLVVTLGAVVLLIFTLRKRKKAGEPAKLQNVVGDIFNGGVEDFINAGKELLDKEWREAKEAVGDGLDDIDKKWDEGMALVKKTADRMTEKQNK